MNKLEAFEVRGDYALFRPTGQCTLKQAVDWVTSAIAFAREQRIRKLLAVTSDLSGFQPPSVGERYFFIQEWAQAARGFVRVAIVARPEMIDREKFGVTVAANVGLISDIFVSEQEALAWLQSVK